MILTIFPRDGGVYPEFHLGVKTGQLFVELDPTGSSVEEGVKKCHAAAVLTSKKEWLPVAETVVYPHRPGFPGPFSGVVFNTVRYQIPGPGTYTVRLFANDKLTLKVKPRKPINTLFDVSIEAQHIIRDSFVGTVKLNGVRLVFCAEEPTESRTIWEHLDADVD